MKYRNKSFYQVLAFMIFNRAMGFLKFFDKTIKTKIVAAETKHEYDNYNVFDENNSCS